MINVEYEPGNLVKRVVSNSTAKIGDIGLILNKLKNKYEKDFCTYRIFFIRKNIITTWVDSYFKAL